MAAYSLSENTSFGRWNHCRKDFVRDTKAYIILAEKREDKQSEDEESGSAASEGLGNLDEIEDWNENVQER